MLCSSWAGAICIYSFFVYLTHDVSQEHMCIMCLVEYNCDYMSRRMVCVCASVNFDRVWSIKKTAFSHYNQTQIVSCIFAKILLIWCNFNNCCLIIEALYTKLHVKEEHSFIHTHILCSIAFATCVLSVTKYYGRTVHIKYAVRQARKSFTTLHIYVWCLQCLSDT